MSSGMPPEPPPSPNPKLEPTGPPSLQHISSMFQPLADCLEGLDSVIPATSNPSLLSDWQATAEKYIDTCLGESGQPLSTTDEQSVAIGKDIAFGLLERFLVAAGHTPKKNAWAAQRPEVRRAAVEELLAKPQVPQRTPAWFAQGKEVLTASEFSHLYGSPRAIGQLVMSKVPRPADAPAPAVNRPACMSCEMTPFDWGARFEPVVKQILSKQWSATLVDSGRLLHPTDTHVAASPDAIILDAKDKAKIGRLVEIKCPIRRTIGEEIPFEYWCQMQLQMEVTGIGECEYVEVKFQSLEGAATDLSGATPDGWLWLFENEATLEMKYAYTPEEKDAAEASGLRLVEAIPWRVLGLHNVVVVRDPAWFEGTAELRAAFWTDVEKARAGAFVLPEPKVRRKAAAAAATGLQVTVTKESAAQECMIQDDA